MKRVSFSLLPEQAETYKALVEPSLQSKLLRHYLLTEFRLPKDLSVIHHGKKSGLKSVPFYFDETADQRLNQIVKDIRDAGYTANRYSVMRYLLDEFIEKLRLQKDDIYQERKIRHSSFYFEKGTREILETYIPFRDRNAVIERFILEEYKPRWNHWVLFEKPIDPEAMRISVAAEAFDKLDGYVQENEKRVTRTALMRDVVEQFIHKLSNSDARKMIAEIKIKKALYEYEEAFGADKLKERVTKYFAEKE